MQCSRKSSLTVLACLAHFSVGAAVAQQPEISKYGAWETQCGPSISNVKVCALVQKRSSEEQPNVGIMVAVRKEPGIPNGVIEFFAPPRTFLLNGVGVKVDEAEFGNLPFFRCTELACAAEGAIRDDLINKMLNGKTMLITIYANPGEGFRHIFTLDGFKDGYNALPQ